MTRLPNPETIDCFSNKQIKLAQIIIKDFVERPVFSGTYVVEDIDRLRDIGQNTLATIYYLEIAARSYDDDYAEAQKRSDEPSLLRIRELQTNVSPLLNEQFESGQIY